MDGRVNVSIYDKIEFSDNPESGQVGSGNATDLKAFGWLAFEL